jgi:ferrous iron transport protein A
MSGKDIKVSISVKHEGGFILLTEALFCAKLRLRLNLNLIMMHRFFGISMKADLQHKHSIPMTMMLSGEERRITDFLGGRSMVFRLRELGFAVGERVQRVSAGTAGPVIIKVKGSKMAIGKGMASKILVA